MDENRAFSTKILATIGELCVIASLFPYQITLNRKEKSFSIRSFLVHFRSEKKEDEAGKTSRELTFRMPGFAFREAAEKVEKKFFEKTPKKKLVLRRKSKKNAQDEK